jgi:hypothetical protein
MVGSSLREIHSVFMSILDSALLGQRYFFPVQRPLGNSFRVAVAPGVELACFWDPQRRGGRTVVYFHGNGSLVDDLLPLCDPFRSLGLDLFLAEYRGYGGSTGSPALATMLSDVEAIFQALELPEEQIVVFGRSVGSLFAIEMASRHPGVAGLILESGVADVLERVLLRVDPEEIGGTREELEAECQRLFDHQAKLSGYRGPFLALHCEGDAVVDVTHGLRNHAWAGGSKKRLVVFPRGGHNDIMAENWDAYWGEIAAFLEELD